MLLLYLTLSLFCVCSSSERVHSICYGRDFHMDLGFHSKGFHGSVLFTPANGRATQLVVNNGKSINHRYKINSFGRLIVSELTEQDSGDFSVILLSGDQPKPLSSLVINDCDEIETSYYGNIFSLHVPRRAEFLEFTPVKKLEQVTVIWNRTDPNGGRGSKVRSYWEITDITQEDNGYYKFRGKDNSLLGWKKLVVYGNKEFHDIHEGESFRMKYSSQVSTVTFEPLDVMGPHPPMKTLSKHDTGGFIDRMKFRPNVIIIDPLIVEDSGVYKFNDKNGNLILRVELNVLFEYPVWTYVFSIGGIIIGMICCCCCIKKCCYKKSSSKRSNPAPHPQAAPAVYHHGTIQPTGPRRTTSPAQVYSYQPTSTSGHRPAAAPGEQAAPPLSSNTSDVLSSNSGPQFELKGFHFSSVSPLSSDAAITDVYYSDKLNFLSDS